MKNSNIPKARIKCCKTAIRYYVVFRRKTGVRNSLLSEETHGSAMAFPVPRRLSINLCGNFDKSRVCCFLLERRLEVTSASLREIRSIFFASDTSSSSIQRHARILPDEISSEPTSFFRYFPEPGASLSISRASLISKTSPPPHTDLLPYERGIKPLNTLLDGLTHTFSIGSR